MGFEAAPTPVTVRFKQGHKYHGAEAQLRGMSIGEWRQATGMDGGEGEGGAKTMDRFFASLVSWNLTLNGEPLPPTPEDAAKADQGLVRALTNAYTESLVGVPDSDPLADSSASGENSLAPPIPMTPVNASENLVS